MSRPQVSIERLPARRASSDSRESMNCKSCRKRKIKCNRTRPSCEACSVFQCPCIYDAVPKKRGPKTDVLEALVKRVDGLEKRLQDENKDGSPTKEITSPTKSSEKKKSNNEQPGNAEHTTGTQGEQQSLSVDTNLPPTMSMAHPDTTPATAGADQSYQMSSEMYSNAFSYPSYPPSAQPAQLPDSVFDTFFSRVNGKPFHILDEASTRQQYQMGQLQHSLSLGIYAVTLRYNPVSIESEATLRRTVFDCTRKARQNIDPDEPSIEAIQTLLLLTIALYANGQGRKAYMTFTNCIGMSHALDLFRELPSDVKLLSTEKETRRRLFWTCYLLDRFVSCGSKRPSLISDNSISLRLPSWPSAGTGMLVEGEIFNAGPNISDPRRKGQDATALLVDITRILGVTNQYLAAGGVKGDSHFPWHSLSNLSKIRQELDIWATGTQDMFASVETFFNHPKCTTLLLSKLIYHLVHCLIYRPFLPIDLVELRGTGQHQSWQIEATNLCFAHSNAIAELVELGKNTPLVEWPGFVSYCVTTAATVHVHGVHYKGTEGDVFSFSPDFLTREMAQLSWLRNFWADVQHQRDMLQTLYNAHSELVNTLASNPLRFSPVFHLEDFFDRYPGYSFDDSHVKMVNMPIDEPVETSANFTFNTPGIYSSHSIHMPRSYEQPHSNKPHRQHHRQQQRQHQNQSQQQPTAAQYQVIPSKLSQPKSHPTSSHEPTTASPTVSFNIPQHNMAGTHQHLPGFSANHQTIQDIPAFSADTNSLPDQFSGSTFSFSPFPTPSDTMLGLGSANPASNTQYATFPFEPQHHQQHGSVAPGTSTTALTPGAQSQGSHGTSSSDHASSEKDPFLMVLEQLAENEQNSLGGPSELDFFLAAGPGTGAGHGAGAADGDGTALQVGFGDGGTGEEGKRIGGTGDDGTLGRSDGGAATVSES